MLTPDEIINNKLNKSNKNQSLISFTSSLFEVEIIAHIAHLQALDKSYPKHRALQELYEGIVDLRDRFIESYQGKYGILKGYQSFTIQEGKDMIAYLTEKVNIAEEARKTMVDGFLQQITDDILELYYGVLYKLKNLPT